jgi:hypothetical protein
LLEHLGEAISQDLMDVDISGVRSEHAALNTLLQAAGAIVMKQAFGHLWTTTQRQWKLDYKFIGNIHDEVQAEVAADQAEKYGWLAVECLKAAGVEFNLRCPLGRRIPKLEQRGQRLTEAKRMKSVYTLVSDIYKLMETKEVAEGVDLESHVSKPIR